MKLAILYAGQGAQHAGMGKDLYESEPLFRAALDAADASVDFDLKQLCFEGPDETLSQTQFTQPCMVAFAAGLTAVLKDKGIRPAAVAGLSLGEYSRPVLRRCVRRSHRCFSGRLPRQGHGTGRNRSPLRNGRYSGAGS